MSPRLLRSPALVFALLVALLACTSDEPAPPPSPAPEPSASPAGPAGLRAGIVLPPAAGSDDPQAAQLEASMRPLQAMLPDEITQLRHVTADGPAFVGDLARLFVDRGTELVCLVGDGVVRLADELAARHPERTFCATPGTTSEAPDNLRVVDVRFEELGHVAGFAAASAADEGAVALVLGFDRIGAVRFRDGVRAGVGGTELLEWMPQTQEAAEQAIADAVAAGAEVLILDVGWQPRDLLAAAEEAGMSLLAPTTAIAGVRFEDAAVLAWTVRWDQVLGPAAARLVDRELEVLTSAGLAEEVFVLTPGSQTPRGPLDQIVADLRDGRRAASPSVDPPAPSPPPDEDADPAPDPVEPQDERTQREADPEPDPEQREDDA